MDYSPLKDDATQPMTRPANSAYRAHTIDGKTAVAMLSLIFGSTFGLIILSLFPNSEKLAMIWLLIAIGLFTNIARGSKRRSMHDFGKIMAFATRNNLNYVNRLDSTRFQPYEKSTSQMMDAAHQAGSILQSTILKTASKENFLSGEEFVVFEQILEQESYGSSTGSRRQEKWTIATIKLSKPLPHVIFDNVKNNLGIFSSLQANFDTAQKLPLEGGFNDYFNVYVPAGYHIDAMSFISPDSMAELMDIGGIYDIEIVDDSINLYLVGNYTPKNLEGILTTLHRIRDIFEDNIDTYRDHRATSVHAATAGDFAIGDQGKRMNTKKGMSSYETILMAVMVIVAAISIVFWILALFT